MIKIISCHPIFNENAVVLSQKFKWELETEFNPQPKDLYIVFGGHEMAPQLLKIQEEKKFNFGYIILNSEQQESQFLKNKYYLQLMKCNAVFDYSNKNIDYLKSNFNIKTYSYFFFEFMHYQREPGEGTPSPKEYDIIFVGSKNQSREELYKKLTERYPNLNIYFDFDWSYKSSVDLTKLLHNSKVVLNIPYYENNTLETHRINKALSCECDVFSLKSADDDANEFYKDYIYFSTQDGLCDLIDVYFRGSMGCKKPYPELIKNVTQLITPHFLFTVNSIHDNFIKNVAL
jgi:hypothetical protein